MDSNPPTTLLILRYADHRICQMPPKRLHDNLSQGNSGFICFFNQISERLQRRINGESVCELRLRCHVI